MPIEIPKSALDRTPASEPDMSYPDFVEITLVWKDEAGRLYTSMQISSDEFFGRGTFGAPLPADAIIQHINRLRRLGPPKP